MKTALSAGQWLLCLQCGLSMMLAFLVTHGSDPTNAIYAVLGAGLVTAPSIGEGLGISKERLIGTLLGAMVSLPSMWLRDTALALAVTSAAVTPLGLLLGGIPVARIAMTVAAVTVVLHTDAAASYGILRFTNTVAGIVTALAVGLLFWPLSKRLDFTQAVRSVIAACAMLADQLASNSPPSVPLDAQRSLFAALSGIPKSLMHIRRDPLLYRVRERLRQEALLAAEIGIALLSISLVAARREAMPIAGEADCVQPLCRHVADRLRLVLRHYPKRMSSETSAALAPSRPTMSAGQPAMPPQIVLISEELLAIDGWLDDLQALLPRA